MPISKQKISPDTIFNEKWNKVAGEDLRIGYDKAFPIISGCIEELGTRTGDPFDEGIFQTKWYRHQADDKVTKQQTKMILGEMTGSHEPQATR